MPSPLAASAGTPTAARGGERVLKEMDVADEVRSVGSSSWASVSPSETWGAPAEPFDAPAHSPADCSGNVPVRPEASLQPDASLYDVHALSLARAPPPQPPPLVPQRLVDQIGAALQASGAEGADEALVVALHALLCQAGFVPSDASVPQRQDDMRALPAGQTLPAGQALPAGQVSA